VSLGDSKNSLFLKKPILHPGVATEIHKYRAGPEEGRGRSSKTWQEAKGNLVLTGAEDQGAGDLRRRPRLT